MSQPNVSPHEDNVLRLLMSKRWMIVRLVALGCAIGGMYTYVRKPQFEGSAVILLPAAQSSAGGSLAQQLGVTLPPSSQTNIYMFKQILQSSRAQSFVASKVGLSRGEVKNRTIVEENSAANSITIRVLDTHNMRALWMVQRYLEALRTIHRDLSIPTKEGLLSDQEKTLAARQSQLSHAEEKLQDFLQSATTAPSLSSSGVATTGRYTDQLRSLEVERARARESLKSVQKRIESAKGRAIELPTDIPEAKPWREKLGQLEYELKVAEISAGPKDPNVVRLKEQIEITKRELNQRVDSYVSAVRAGLVDPSAESGIASLGQLSQTLAGIDAQIAALRRLADIAPEEAVQFQRLATEVASLTKLVEQARLQVEQARSEAGADPNRWEILDAPEVSDKPVNKDYVKNVAVAGAVSFVLALAFALSSPGPTSSRGGA